MSAPEGASVNDGIDGPLGSLTYVSINDAADGIRSLGKGSIMAKVDVRRAYRNIPVHREDRWLMGMRWDRALFVDTALPFGLRSAAKIFTAVADAVEWIAKHEGVRFVIHYLDDFLVVGAPSSQECAIALAKLLEIFHRLGLPVAEGKLEGPATCLGFLGFEIDSEVMAIRLPPEKLAKTLELLRQWQGRKACTRKELESIVGKLSHAARVVVPGRTFIRGLLGLIRGTRQPHHRIRLSLASRSDIQWWLTFLDSWNGVSMIRSPTELRPPVHIWTDALAAAAWIQARSRGSSCSGQSHTQPDG